MYIFLFCMVLLVPVLFVAVGRIWIHHPPKEINGIYGYRTEMSMKNRDTWDFAHRTCGKLWFRSGLAMGVISVVLMIVFREAYESLSLILVFSQVGVMIALIFPVEIALRKRFDKDGSRKE